MIVRLVLTLLLAFPVAAAPIGYYVLSGGVPIGRFSVDRRGNSVHMAQSVVLQGKVRALDVVMRSNARRLPVSIERQGQAFLYYRIAERFAADARSARWHNRVETGSAPADGRYYVPFDLGPGIDAVPAEAAELARALLRAPGRRLALLPDGEARLQVVGTVTASQAGKPKRLRLVAIAGLDFDPWYLWLDDADELVAGLGAVRDGWDAALPSLDAAVAAADAEASAAAIAGARTAARHGDFRIADVAVFDAPTARLLPHRDVDVAAGRIAAITAAGTMPLPAGSRRIDGAGRTLLPGFHDLHVHLRGRQPLQHLANGVTTVRDLGNDNIGLAQLVARIEAGDMPGPHVVRSGFIDRAGPGATPLGRRVGSEAEALAAVDAYADAGFPAIKIYGEIAPDWVPAMAARAHGRGLRVGGHVPIGMTADAAITAGYDEIQHLIYLFLNFAAAQPKRELTFATARAAQGVDPDGAGVAALAERMRAHNVAMDMTLGIYEVFLASRPGVASPVFAQFGAGLPLQVRRSGLAGPLPTPVDLPADAMPATFAKALRLAARLDAAGVQLLVGTDFAPLPGLAYHHELQLLVAAGLSPARVLQLATIRSAERLGRAGGSGSITVGKAADLVLVAGDPVADITAVEHIVMVARDGVAYDPGTLLRASGLR